MRAMGEGKVWLDAIGQVLSVSLLPLILITKRTIMIFHKTAIAAILTTGLAGVSGQAFAHQYYNLTGAGTVASGDSAIGFGITNSINGTDGVSANSNGTNRVSNGTTVYNATSNNFISGTGSAAATATEIPGNLPYMWYSGQHSTALGVTKRDHYTGTSATDSTANMLSGMSATAASNTSLTLPNGQVLVAPGTSNWGTNNTSSLWKAYNDKNTLPANVATWGTVMADLPGAPSNDHPYQAVAGNSAETSLGLDYGLIHVSCGTNTAADNCAKDGDVLTTITIKNDSDYSALNGLLDVALYRNVDTSTTSDRDAASAFGSAGFQGSSLGEAIWTASMSSVSDILFYSFIFNQAEWNATGTPGYETNGFYTLVIGAHGGTGSAADAVVYDVLVTTSAVPVPGAVWLFGSALAGFVGFGRRKTTAA
jgi:hypothetical protein